MSPAEVKNLFFRLMSSGRNGGGGRQEGSAVSEGEPLPSPMTLTVALASTAIPYQRSRGAPGLLAHVAEVRLCMGACVGESWEAEMPCARGACQLPTEQHLSALCLCLVRLPGHPWG